MCTDITDYDFSKYTSMKASKKKRNYPLRVSILDLLALYFYLFSKNSK